MGIDHNHCAEDRWGDAGHGGRKGWLAALIISNDGQTWKNYCGYIPVLCSKEGYDNLKPFCKL